MKKPIDKPRKRKDTPAVSKKDFIAAYRKAAMQGGFTAEEFSVDYATSVVEDVISGRWMPPAVPWMKPAPACPSMLLQEVARAHGAKRGRVGNFLRSLK